MKQEFSIKSNRLGILIIVAYLQFLILILLARAEIFWLRIIGRTFLYFESLFLRSVIEVPGPTPFFIFVIFITLPTVIATYSGLRSLEPSNPKKIFSTMPKMLFLSLLGIGLVSLMLWFPLGGWFVGDWLHILLGRGAHAGYLISEALIINLISIAIIAPILYKKYGKKKLEKVSVGPEELKKISEEPEIPKYNEI